MNEALDSYNNSVTKAISEMLGIDEPTAAKIQENMPIDKVIEFAIAADTNPEDAQRIISKYQMTVPSPMQAEAVAQKMHYLVKTRADNVVIPEFKRLSEMEQREVLAEMQNSELQKILANLRGNKHPSIYEGSIFDIQLFEEIIRTVKNTNLLDIFEMDSMAPGAQQRTQAYGATAAPAATQPNQSTPGKKTATFKNDNDEDEEAEILSQDAKNVTLKTKTGTKRVPIEQAMVNEDKDLADIIRLSGIRRK